MAALLDLVLMIVLLVLVGALLGDADSSDSSVSVQLEGLSALVYFALAFLYYWLLESRDGQTVGKKLLGVRVIGADGSEPGAGRIALRTLLRVVDGFALYLVGLIVALLTGDRRQRLGDLAARTRVVRA